LAQLWQLAKLIRSKNAGPFELTFDILFDDRATFERVNRSGVLAPEAFARAYAVPVGKVKFFIHEAALAFKISLPRTAFSGDLDDTDVFGGQFHSPLVCLEVDNDPPGRAAIRGLRGDERVG
jgi:hypothetical protein